jgi:hypothetical protein
MDRVLMVDSMDSMNLAAVNNVCKRLAANLQGRDRATSPTFSSFILQLWLKSPVNIIL